MKNISIKDIASIIIIGTFLGSSFDWNTAIGLTLSIALFLYMKK